VFLLVTQQVNKEILNELIQKGFRNVKTANTRKAVIKFEENPNSKEIFDTIYGKPFLRTVVHLLLQQKLPITKDQVGEVLRNSKERLKVSLKGSPDKNILCQTCSEIINRYNTYEENKPSWKMKCPKCNTPNELSRCKEEDDWSFPLISITSYLDQLVRIGILTSTVLRICTRCNRSESFKQIPFKSLDSLSERELRSYAKKFYCTQCGRFYDLTEIYSMQESMLPFWAKGNGVWLEWYVKNIIRKHLPDCPVEQGLIVKNKEAIQVDVVLLKGGKIFSFECKALSPRKSASFNEVSDALKPLDFSDEVFLVTTTVLKENDKRILLRTGAGKLKIVEGPRVENIIEFLGD